jgi:hypothetical protein
MTQPYGGSGSYPQGPVGPGVPPSQGGWNAPPPPRNKLLPWLIGAAVIVVALAGVLAFVLLKADDNAPSENAAASRSTQADQRGDIDGNAVVPPDADQEELPGDVIPPEDGGGAYWEHSMDKAAAFMDDVVLGDYPSAISHGSQDFQAVFSDGTELFGQQIAEATNGGTLGDYSLDWATYDATVDADVVSITITMEEGWPDDFTVLVSEEDGYLVVVGFE